MVEFRISPSSSIASPSNLLLLVGMLWEMILVDFQGRANVFVFRRNGFLSMSSRGVDLSGGGI